MSQTCAGLSCTCCQLNPLTYEINAIGARLKILNLESIIGDCHQILERWRVECHQKIDEFFEEKYQEVDRIVIHELDKQRQQTVDIKMKLDDLVRAQETMQNGIDSLSSNIRSITNDINVIEKTYRPINTSSLVIDGHLFQNKVKTDQNPFDPSCFSTIYKTINYPDNHCHVLASNNQFLLAKQKTYLCLIDQDMKISKQTPYISDLVFDMCWSSTLTHFIMIVDHDVYFLDENIEMIENIELKEKRLWFSCTCSDMFLFLSTFEFATSIIKFSLLNSLQLINEWKSPDTCSNNERIDRIVYNNGTLCLMIANSHENHIRLELRSSNTLDRIWTMPLDIVYNQSLAAHCCSLNHSGWLVADFSTRSLSHITNDGKIKTKILYSMIPYRVSLFGSNLLVIATEKGVNFHKISIDSN